MASILPFQYETQYETDSDAENIEQKDRTEPLHAQMLQDILK